MQYKHNNYKIIKKLKQGLMKKNKHYNKNNIKKYKGFYNIIYK